MYLVALWSVSGAFVEYVEEPLMARLAKWLRRAQHDERGGGGAALRLIDGAFVALAALATALALGTGVPALLGGPLLLPLLAGGPPT